MKVLERRPAFLTLKAALLTDAVLSCTVGVVSLAGATTLGPVLDLPKHVLAGSGAIAMAYGATLLWWGTRPVVSSAAGRCVVIGNVVWAAAGSVLLLSGWIQPGASGTTFVLAHIVGALILAEIEHLAMRTGDQGMLTRGRSGQHGPSAANGIVRERRTP